MTLTVLRGEAAVQWAAAIATEAHGSQKDKIGRPYHEHLQAVAEGTDALGGTHDDVAAAWLHDTIEDTTITETFLREEGFSDTTVSTVLAVTKTAHEPQLRYLSRIIANGQSAMRVKLADLYHNTAPDRLAQLSDYTQERLLTKYSRAVGALEAILEVPVQTRRGVVLAEEVERLRLTLKWLPGQWAGWKR